MQQHSVCDGWQFTVHLVSEDRLGFHSHLHVDDLVVVAAVHVPKQAILRILLLPSNEWKTAQRVSDLYVEQLSER